MTLVDRNKVLLWDDDSYGSYGEYPHYLAMSRNFKNGTEHFEEWKDMREVMQDIRMRLEARNWFMS